MTPWLDVLLASLHLLVALIASSHALLNKRDPRSAWAWIAVCALLPFVGVLFYFWFGINRIERRARRELGSAPDRYQRGAEPMPDVPGLPQEVRELVRIGRIMAGQALVPGNRVTPLHNGEQAYPDMLAAIAAANSSPVWSMSKMYVSSHTVRFAAALAAATRRGVQVRVLLDGIGHLSWRTPASRVLADLGVPVAKFLPPRWWPPMLHVNLRNHHKLMTVDGEAAWVGGMNISDRHCAERSAEGVADLHFRVEGPVVAQLEGVFADTWRFAAGEKLVPAAPAAARGDTFCRAITDGPNDAVDRLQLVLLAAIANAHKRICIMTPYFIPTPELSGALQSAALRGVTIDVVLPRRSDQWWVDGATRRWLTQLVGRSIQVYYRPAPFAHTKLFLMDDYYGMIGSANLDPRSLRLNFELVVELYDGAGAVRDLRAHFDEVRGASREITEDALRRRPLLKRLGDSVLWLFSPYL